MGSYRRGDVVLAVLDIAGSGTGKMRPAVVLDSTADGRITLCPVSSKPSFDAVSLPLTLEDFAEGGLDLFSESFLLVTRQVTLRSGNIMGKKGKLTDDALDMIAAAVCRKER